MSYQSFFVPEAQAELINAWTWYEDKNPGLGDKFLNEVYKRITQIEANPERYPQRKHSFHETIVKIFPYLIIYRIEKRMKLIIITSIFHTSRNPRKKYNR